MKAETPPTELIFEMVGNSVEDVKSQKPDISLATKVDLHDLRNGLREGRDGRIQSCRRGERILSLLVWVFYQIRVVW